MRKLGNSPLKLAFAVCFSSVALLSAPAYADYKEGFDALVNGDYATALYEFKVLAEQGNSGAQLNLGSMYLNGLGVTQSDQEASKWYKLAAEQGNADAQHSLGVIYSRGEGVLQHYREALDWYQMAAKRGNASSQVNLGLMYGKGEGAPQDYVHAHMWSNIASSNGEDIGAANRAIFAEKMTPSQIEQAQEMARNCLNSGYEDCGE